jgi:preprotein translocase subunit SecG
MFGGGVSTNLGSSGVAERNLNRFTIMMALLWITVIVVLGVLERFSS